MQSFYLAPISHYREALRSHDTSFDILSRYSKQTWHNRCVIDSPNGALTLSIPVVNPHKAVPVSDIRISEHGNWRHQHWNALCSSYRQTPYFDYYADDFAPFYHEKRWDFLVDFNYDLHQTVKRLMGWDGIMDRGLEEKLATTCRGEEYSQIFALRHGFIPDLSIVDVLFNMGPEAVLYL